MRFGSVFITSYSPLFDAIGHNTPRRSVQVVGVSLHDVLIVCSVQLHILCNAVPEPPVHRAVCPFRCVAHLADCFVHGSLAFCQSAALL